MISVGNSAGNFLWERTGVLWRVDTGKGGPNFLFRKPHRILHVNTPKNEEKNGDSNPESTHFLPELHG
jgi:hypothetical protein